MENLIRQFLAINNGYGDGNGDGDGYGYGYGDGYGLKSIGEYIIHIIDNTPTIITRLRGNIATGYIINSDLTLEPCYIVKENNNFAHGNTLHDAFLSLQEKLYDNSTEEERIKKFLEKFPSFDKPYPAKELFAYHHILTGSCRFGRENFCRERCINIDTDSYTIEEFIALTKDHYNGHIIQQLKSFYS